MVAATAAAKVAALVLQALLAAPIQAAAAEEAAAMVEASLAAQVGLVIAVLNGRNNDRPLQNTGQWRRA